MLGANKEKGKERKSDPPVIFLLHFNCLYLVGKTLENSKHYCLSLASLGTEIHL